MIYVAAKKEDCSIKSYKSVFQSVNAHNGKVSSLIDQNKNIRLAYNVLYSAKLVKELTKTARAAKIVTFWFQERGELDFIAKDVPM